MKGCHSQGRPTGQVRRSPWFTILVALGCTALAAVVSTGTTWALMTNQASGGPESLVTAVLNPAPAAPSVANNGCSGTSQRTNVGVGWSDTQATTADAAGGSLITGYSVGRSTTATGTYATAGTVSGSPAATAFTDTPTVASSGVSLVVNTAKQTVPFSESSLTSGTALTVGTASNQVGAIQISPNGLTAVLAEYSANQVQILTWSGTVWSVAKTLAVATPTAVAIDPILNASALYIAYVVSDPGTTSNGSVIPITLNGSSSTLGTAIAVQRQANPTAIAITPNGAWVYVANYSSSSVSAINTSTSTATTVALPGTSAHPVALAITGDSTHIYVADRANGYVDDITVATNVVGTHLTLPANALNDAVLTSSGDPNLLVMSPNGQSLYVAEVGAAQVQQLNTALAASPDTIGVTISTGSGSKPVDLAESPNGCLIYVAESSAGKILSITTSTNAEATAFTTTCQIQDPQAMAVTPDNQYLLVPENSGCGDLQILNTSSSAVTTVTTVGTAPTMVAVPPVPAFYKVTATHSGWNSNPSSPTSITLGWNPGGWQ